MLSPPVPVPVWERTNTSACNTGKETGIVPGQQATEDKTSEAPTKAIFLFYPSWGDCATLSDGCHAHILSANTCSMCAPFIVYNNL